MYKGTEYLFFYRSLMHCICLSFVIFMTTRSVINVNQQIDTVHFSELNFISSIHLLPLILFQGLWLWEDAEGQRTQGENDPRPRHLPDELNSGRSCYEASVLTTVPLCCPVSFHSKEIVQNKFCVCSTQIILHIGHYNPGGVVKYVFGPQTALGDW